MSTDQPSTPLELGQLREWAEVKGTPSLLPAQLFLPLSSKERKKPVIVFLHGGGDGPFNIMNKQSLPSLLLNNRSFAASFPFITLAPCSTCHGGASRGWTEANFERVDRLILKVIKEHGGDPSRLYLTGQSMGGAGLWRYAQARRSPPLFAALVPVCAAARPPVGKLDVCDGAACPGVWAFHGANDAVVPVRYSDQWVEALRKRGSAQQVRYTRYEWAPPPPMREYSSMTGHASYEYAYREAALYEWLLSQRCSACAGPSVRAHAAAATASKHGARSSF